MSHRAPSAALSPERRADIRRMFEELPSEFPPRIAAIGALRDAFHLELAAAMRVALTRHLATIPQDSVERMRATASYVNETLRSVGLAIRAKDAPEAATLIADAKHTQHGTSTVYRLQHRDAEGRAVRTTLGPPPLPILTLIPYVPRERFWEKRSATRGDLER